MASSSCPAETQAGPVVKHHHGTGCAEDLSQAVALCAGHDRDRPVSRGRRPRALLVAEVGDHDAMRPSRLDARLDGRTDVVDVHVHVPEVLTSDDQDRVTQGIELVTERRTRHPAEWCPRADT